MAIWESIPLDKRSSTIYLVKREIRKIHRKSKINNLFNAIRKEVK